MRAVGEQLGLSAELIEVVLAEACLTAAALLKGDEATSQLIRPLRHASIAWRERLPRGSRY